MCPVDASLPGIVTSVTSIVHTPGAHVLHPTEAFWNLPSGLLSLLMPSVRRPLPGSRVVGVGRSWREQLVCKIRPGPRCRLGPSPPRPLASHLTGPPSPGRLVHSGPKASSGHGAGAGRGRGWGALTSWVGARAPCTAGPAAPPLRGVRSVPCPAPSDPAPLSGHAHHSRCHATASWPRVTCREPLSLPPSLIPGPGSGCHQTWDLQPLCHSVPSCFPQHQGTRSAHNGVTAQGAMRTPTSCSKGFLLGWSRVPSLRDVPPSPP